jgi:hypothetical protein
LLQGHPTGAGLLPQDRHHALVQLADQHLGHRAPVACYQAC